MKVKGDHCSEFTISNIYFTSFHCTGRYEVNKSISLPMCGFTALLVEHHTGIAQVTVFFFRPLPSNCLNWKSFNSMNILLFHLQAQYNMNFVHISQFWFLFFIFCLLLFALYALRMSHSREVLLQRAPRNFSRPCRFATTLRISGHFCIGNMVSFSDEDKEKSP